MSNIADTLTRYEQSLRARGIKLSDVLDTACVDRSTWTRWKSGKSGPRLHKWMEVEAAVAAALDTKKSERAA